RATAFAKLLLPTPSGPTSNSDAGSRSNGPSPFHLAWFQGCSAVIAPLDAGEAPHAPHPRCLWHRSLECARETPALGSDSLSGLGRKKPPAPARSDPGCVCPPFSRGRLLGAGRSKR